MSDSEQAPDPNQYKVSRPVYTYAKFNEEYDENIRDHRTAVQAAKVALGHHCGCTRSDWRRRAVDLVPFVARAARGKYSANDALNDVIAGITTCVFHIPQGLAYGQLAGLQPVNGLYTSLIPVLIYAVFARSRHVSLGTFSLMSLLLADMIEDNSPVYLKRMSANITDLPRNITQMEYARLQTAIVGSFVAGGIVFLIGACRLGFFMRYMSDSMLKGFTFGASVHIFLSQLPVMLGVKPKKATSTFKAIANIHNIVAVADKANYLTVGISVTCFLVLFLVKEYVNPIVKKKIKAPLPIELIVIVVALLISHFTNLNVMHNVTIVGNVPSGMPAPLVPDFGFAPQMLSPALPVGLVGAAMTLSLAKIYCLQFHYSFDFNEEFVILGITNIVSSFFQCFFASGALARNAVVVSVGMQSQLASLISCAGMLVIVLVAGPLFTSVPTCSLAAIIAVSLVGVVRQATELPHIWHISRIDFLVWTVSAASVIITDVTLGLVISFAFTLFSVIMRTQSPRVAVLGRMGSTDIYKNVLVYSAAQELPNTRIIRFDAPLHFANAERFSGAVRDVVQRGEISGKSLPNSDAAALRNVHTVIFDCSSWVYIDMVGVRTAKEVYSSLKAKNIRVLFANCKEPIRIRFFVQNFFKDVEKSLFFISLHDACLHAETNLPNDETAAAAAAAAAAAGDDDAAAADGAVAADELKMKELDDTVQLPRENLNIYADVEDDNGNDNDNDNDNDADQQLLSRSDASRQV